MLFVSPHPLYQMTGIRKEKITYHPVTGVPVDTSPEINAEFTHGGVPEWAMEIALAYRPFQERWGGLPEGVDPRTYVSRYDTDREAERLNWDDETKVYVENFLLNHDALGFHYIQAESPVEQEAPPWFNYEKTHWKQVVQTAKTAGIPLDYVLGYEERTLKRPGVLEQLREEIGESEELVVA